MAIPVTIPRLGWNMEEGTFIEWLKAEGDAIRPGDSLFKLEGEKSVEEVQTLDAGILHIPAGGPKPGDRLSVGATIGYLLEPGETVTGEVAGAGIAINKERETPRTSVPSSIPAASPSVRRLARERGIDLATVRGSGPGGRIEADDVPARSSERVAAITPRARRLAKRAGVDWSDLQGSGRNGRIRERDIAAIANAQNAQKPDIIPLTTFRKTVAARMMESRRSTAPVTLTSVVDAANLVNLRGQFKLAGSGLTPSYTDFLIKLCGTALSKHPHLAARWTDAGIVLAESIDIGMAIDTAAGLLVPVIRNVPALGLRDIAGRSRDLIDLAQKGGLTGRDLQGGCFTITNLGAFGIEAFTPIINPPECAILGVGRIARQPVVDGDRVIGRERVTLSLTFDHRIVDGAPAARFLQTLAQLIENPGPWLVV